MARLVRVYRRSLVARLLLVIIVAALGVAGISALAKDRTAPFNQPPRSVRTLAYDVKHTTLQLRLDFDKQAVDGIATHMLAPFDDLDRIQFDIGDMTIVAVAIARDDKEEPQQVEFDKTDDKLIVHPASPLLAGKDVIVKIAYRVENPKLGAFRHARQTRADSAAHDVDTGGAGVRTLLVSVLGYAE